jgi:hypothetical protein
MGRDGVGGRGSGSRSRRRRRRRRRRREREGGTPLPHAALHKVEPERGRANPQVDQQQGQRRES